MTQPGGSLESTGSYLPVLLIAGSAYLFALLIVHLLVQRLEPAQLTTPSPPTLS